VHLLWVQSRVGWVTMPKLVQVADCRVLESHVRECVGCASWNGTAALKVHCVPCKIAPFRAKPGAHQGIYHCYCCAGGRDVSPCWFTAKGILREYLGAAVLLVCNVSAVAWPILADRGFRTSDTH
jgi:hypothetical protein